jgi:hypothetical protein
MGQRVRDGGPYARIPRNNDGTIFAYRDAANERPPASIGGQIGGFDNERQKFIWVHLIARQFSLIQ